MPMPGVLDHRLDVKQAGRNVGAVGRLWIGPERLFSVHVQGSGVRMRWRTMRKWLGKGAENILRPGSATRRPHGPAGPGDPLSPQRAQAGWRSASNPSINGWFTEGFDTADLQEARALLKDLSS
jgi:hypothetical protein